MPDLKTHLSGNLIRIVDRFDEQLRLARAAELASCSRLMEAESLLCTDGKLPRSSISLDYLARIHVKQGRLELAKRRWEDAIKSTDHCEEFEDCLKVLEDYGKRVFERRLLLWKINLGLVVTALLLSIWMLVSLIGSTAR